MTILKPAGPCALPASALKANGVAAAELAASCLAHIALREPLVRAWAYLDEAQVRTTAAAADAAPAQAPLHGIPVGIKDVILTRDMPTRYNTNLPRESATGADAASVAILRHAGALIFGKTDTVEFASIGRRALTRNPHDAGRTPGASSSGSAAAVADYHVPLALGTQTAGSIIRPASFCGVYGFKPSWGLVCMDGVRPFAPSLDTLGWFAREAADVALMLDPFEPSPPIAGSATLRIGVCRTPMWAHAAPATRAAMSLAAQRFAAGGARLSDVELPSEFARLPAAQTIIMRAEGGRSFQAEAARFGDRLHIALRRMVHDLRHIDRPALLAAYNLAAACRTVFDDLAGEYDAILTPSSVGEAPESVRGTGDYLFNGLWTLLHTPCLNLPAYVTPQGLPVGVTLTGARFTDRRLLAAAAWFESVTG